MTLSLGLLHGLSGRLLDRRPIIGAFVSVDPVRLIALVNQRVLEPVVVVVPRLVFH